MSENIPENTPSLLRQMIEHVVTTGNTSPESAKAVRLAAEEQRDAALAALVDAAHRLLEAAAIASADPAVFRALGEAAQAVVRIAVTRAGTKVSVAGLAADGSTGTEVLVVDFENDEPAVG
jgi:orotate phosphoribosyltransferase